MTDAPTIEAIERQISSELETLLSLKPGSITTETSLPTLGIDSLRFVSLLLAIEQKFGVNLMKTGLKRHEMQTVRTMAAVVDARRKS